jgi:hypothetical protein
MWYPCLRTRVTSVSGLYSSVFPDHIGHVPHAPVFDPWFKRLIREARPTWASAPMDDVAARANGECIPNIVQEWLGYADIWMLLNCNVT